jgi:hypothetical protein
LKLSVAALIAGCALCINALHAQPSAPPVRGGPELQALMALPVGAKPAQEMHWPQVLDALGRPDDAARLRAALLHLWLMSALAEPLPDAQAVSAWIRSAKSAPPLPAGEVTDARWAGAVQRHLQPRPASQPHAIPADIDGLAAQLTEAAPGLWLHHDRQGVPQRLFAWVEFSNVGAMPFPLTAMQLQVGEARLECDLPRGTVPALVPPGEAGGLLCRLPSLVLLGRTPAATWFQTTYAAHQWRTLPGAFSGETQQRLVADALAAPLQGQRDAWLQQRRDRMRTEGEAARAQAAAASAAKERRDALRHRLITAAVVIGGSVGYAVAARALGRVAASVLLWLVGMVVCVPLGLSILRGNWADSWGGIVAIPLAFGLFAAPTVMAFVAAALYTFVGLLWNDPAYRARVIWGFALLLGLFAAELLVRLLVRIF